MPPKGKMCSLAQIQSMQNARDLQALGTLAPINEQPSNVNQLSVSSLLEALSLKDEVICGNEAELKMRKAALSASNELVERACNTAKDATERADRFHAAVRANRRKLQRSQISNVKMKEQLLLLQSLQAVSKEDIAILESLLQRDQKELGGLHEDAMETSEHITNLMEGAATEIALCKEKLAQSKLEVRALKARLDRAPGIRERDLQKALGKMQKNQQVFDLMAKGIYTPQARALARNLVTAGCSQDSVGILIQKIAHTVGVQVPVVMSRRTVHRAIAEGGIAAKMQLGMQVAGAKSLTVSNDSTQHRHTEFVAHHINFMDENGEHKSHLLGVRPAISHTSEEQVKNWEIYINELGDVFSKSPLAKQTKASLQWNDFLQKCKGGNGDHANDQKLVYEILAEMKAELALQTLGSECLVEMDLQEYDDLLSAEGASCVEKAGGSAKFNALSAEEKAKIGSDMMKDMTQRLGKDAYNKLSDQEKRKLDLFVWAGCCMHKDLNSVKGGNKAMMEFWAQLGVVGPILLANRDNAPVIDEITEDEILTPAQERAMNVTVSGGVKAAGIAGAIFNHKDDKKGYQDMHKRHFEGVTGKYLKFPDTSNTRYQSYSEAAGELLTYRFDYLELLDEVRLSKTKPRLNHMEANLKASLEDNPTLTELAVLVLYAQAISHPYMRKARGPGSENINMLNMGPLHKEVKDHMQKIIDEPSILLSPNASHKLGALHGQEWHRVEAFEALQKLSSQLPHLEGALVAFLKGAMITWDRFTSKFAPGGAIDLASVDERELAWMPPTNDVNEGALGAFRLYMRKKPKTTSAQYNALAMFNFNRTEEFMEKYFTAEDHAYVRKAQREAEGDHAERKMREALNDAKKAKAAARRKKNDELVARRAKAAEALEKVNRVEKAGDIGDWNVQGLKDQLELYRNLKQALHLEELVIPLKSHLKNKAEQFAALVATIDWCNSNGYGGNVIEQALEGDSGADESNGEAGGDEEEHL